MAKKYERLGNRLKWVPELSSIYIVAFLRRFKFNWSIGKNVIIGLDIFQVSIKIAIYSMMYFDIAKPIGHLGNTTITFDVSK